MRKLTHFLKNSAWLGGLLALPLISLASPTNKICLTGRIVESLPSYGRGMQDAAHLALKQSGLAGKVKIESFFYNNSPLSPISAYHRMLKSGCSAIVGFAYLSDLKLVAKVQKNLTIPIFTSYANTEFDKPIAKNIFIFRPSYHLLARKMLAFMKKHYQKINRVLLVTEVSRDSMKAYKRAYVSLLKQSNIQFETFDFLESGHDLVKNLKSYLKTQKKFDFIFLLSGAISAAKVVDNLNERNTVFIGTENYGSSSSATFYIRLKKRDIESYFIRSLDLLKPNKLLAGFECAYRATYHIKPLILSAYTYDAVRLSLASLKQYGTLSTEAVKKTVYHGITGIRSGSGQFSPSRQWIILKVSDKGYQYVKAS